MSYISQDFEDGKVLTASHLNNLEKGILDNEYNISNLSKLLDVKVKSLEDLIYNIKNEGKTSFSWLAVGNSFARDTMYFMYNMLVDLGFTDITLGILYIGSCTIQTHINNITNNKAAYEYDLNTNGTWGTTKNYTIKTAIESRDWDIISMQQASGTSGIPSSYDDVPNLLSSLKSLSGDNTKYVWLMTWAYSSDATHSAFPTYNKDQILMYNSIINAVQEKIIPLVNSGDIYTIIPSGTAIQNSRTSILGDTLTRDGYHLDFDIGRYSSGIMATKSLTKKDINKINYCPSGEDMGADLNGGNDSQYIVKQEDKIIALESAENAYIYPFKITTSKYKEYAKINFNKSAYYWTTSENPVGYENLVTKDNVPSQNNHDFYWSTQKFTKEELPIGSIIIISEGYSYRPEAWLSTGPNTNESRPKNTNERVIKITETWWNNYTHRAFNIFKGTSPSVDISNMTESEINNIFKIILYK